MTVSASSLSTLLARRRPVGDCVGDSSVPNGADVGDSVDDNVGGSADDQARGSVGESVGVSDSDSGGVFIGASVLAPLLPAALAKPLVAKVAA